MCLIYWFYYFHLVHFLMIYALKKKKLLENNKNGFELESTTEILFVCYK